MKKIIIALTAMVAVATLSSFVINNHHSAKTEMGNDYIYYTSTTAWRAATESTTIYIFYKEGNGVRSYAMSCDRNPIGFVSTISPNPYYHDKECDDYRRNYRYTARGCGGWSWYFNCNLPKMER